MKVLDLCCTNQHRFEGWFKSDADFETQSGSGLIVCPLCEATGVVRMPSAPRLNLSGAVAPQVADRSGKHAPAEATATTGQPQGQRQGQPQQPQGQRQGQPQQPQGQLQALQAAWMTAMRQVVARTEDVGERFTEEARKMHYDEAPARGIRGMASPEQMHALLDEGIEVLSLPMPSALKDPLQ